MAQIDDQSGMRLVQLARAAVAAEVAGDDLPAPDPETWPIDARPGVFVTLRKQTLLRGCIGTFSPREDVPSTVVEMARAAARDPRFLATPICASEVSHLRIEVSLLSPLERIEDPLAFERGRHGLYLKHGSAAGCFLPEVGIEQGWDRETFLSELCRQKAGLPPQAWRDREAEISTFTVQKFAG